MGGLVVEVCIEFSDVVFAIDSVRDEHCVKKRSIQIYTVKERLTVNRGKWSSGAPTSAVAPPA